VPALCRPVTFNVYPEAAAPTTRARARRLAAVDPERVEATTPDLNPRFVCVVVHTLSV
jgi:hypothetical protein